MAWCRQGNKPLSEPMTAQFTDIHASLSPDLLRALRFMSLYAFLKRPSLEDQVPDFQMSRSDLTSVSGYQDNTL